MRVPLGVPLRVALFVPCYVDQLTPKVAWATVATLEHLGCEVSFDPEQTCCGQVLLNTGDREGARRLATRFLDVFGSADHVVAPSASCVATVRRHYEALLPEAARLPRVRELCEFVVEELGIERIGGRFPHRVGLHPSCHGLRELGLGSASELHSERPDPARRLLGSIDGLELVAPERPDECCGFGGSFAVAEAAVSGRMGRDRVGDHHRAGAEVLTSTDVSCLTHLDGIARRGALPLRVLHVAEVLAEARG